MMKRIILSSIILCGLAGCEKDPADPATCDVFVMAMEDFSGMNIQYDKQGRIISYERGNSVISYDYGIPGRINGYYNGSNFQRYKLNSQGQVVERVESAPYIFDSVQFEYNAEGFLILEQKLSSKGKTEFSRHIMENGNRVMTLRSSYNYPSFVDTIKYYYQMDSLAPFYGGDRLTYQLKIRRYTNLLKETLWTRNWDSLRVDWKYSYEYRNGRLAEIWKRSKSGSYVGQFIYWWCDM